LTKAMAEQLGLGNGKTQPSVYRGRGCKKCFNSGYSGRVVIAEVLTISPAIKQIIIKRGQECEMKAAARQEGMQTLRENGVAKILEGVTTVDEILRVTAPDEKIKES